MSAALLVCLGAVYAAAALLVWVAFGVAHRGDRISGVVLVQLVGHLDRFERDLACPAAAAPSAGRGGGAP